MLPSSAIASDDGGGAYVWRVNPESMTVQRQPITVGNFSGKNQIEVKAGLATGHWIAVTGVHHLREGMIVRRLEELQN